MVVRDTPWPAGTPGWVDLTVDDMAKATAFYSALFGWDIAVEEAPEAGGYAMARKDGKDVAGLGPKQDPAMPSVWTTYLAVDDVDATVGRIKDAGGQVVMPPLDVLEHGRMALAVDPGGAVFGLWQSGTHNGMQLANAPGAVVWNENLTTEFETNKVFYGAVFGYTYEDVGDDTMVYAMLQVNGNTVGGIGEPPPGVPAHWSTYFEVEDTDQAVARITELGGSVTSPPMDTPWGRMASVTDDQGCAFAVIGSTGDAQS
jgi:predicted enzyme related to lactoylglutathione lyase